MPKYPMGALLLIIILFMAGCGFDTQGQPVAKYRHPRQALLVMDVQADFTGERARMPVDPGEAEQMMGHLNALIDKAPQKGWVVIYIRNVFSKGDRIANLFRNNAAVTGSPGVDFDPRLNVVNQNIFRKNQPDAFSNRNFERFLARQRINELYITGVFADQCVFWTAKGALNRGYKVNYLSDCVAAKTSQDTRHAVAEIRKEGAIIRQSASL